MILLTDQRSHLTFSLRELLASRGSEVEILLPEQAEAILSMNSSPLIIAPGPCDNGEGGRLAEVIARCRGEIPVLGVGTGLHALALAFGAKLTRSWKVSFGKAAGVIHDGRTLFEGIPSPMQVGRYDAHVVDEDDLPEVLEISAHSKEGEIMALRHCEEPIEGVQFHPESLLTPRGEQLIDNFLETYCNGRVTKPSREK